MSGYVYILTNPSFRRNYIKIGYTRGDPAVRALDLSRDTAVPEPFKVYAEWKVKSPAESEARIHERFDHCRINERREFFDMPPWLAAIRIRWILAFL